MYTIEIKSFSKPKDNIFVVIFLNKSYDAFLDLELESLSPTMSSGKNV